MNHNQMAPVGQEDIAHRYGLTESWMEGRSRQATNSLWLGVVKCTPTAVSHRGRHGTRMEAEKAIRRVWGVPQPTAGQDSGSTAGHCT